MVSKQYSPFLIKFNQQMPSMTIPRAAQLHPVLREQVRDKLLLIEHDHPGSVQLHNYEGQSEWASTDEAIESSREAVEGVLEQFSQHLFKLKQRIAELETKLVNERMQEDMDGLAHDSVAAIAPLMAMLRHKEEQIASLERKLTTQGGRHANGTHASRQVPKALAAYEQPATEECTLDAAESQELLEGTLTPHPNVKPIGHNKFSWDIPQFDFDCDAYDSDIFLYYGLRWSLNLRPQVPHASGPDVVSLYLCCHDTDAHRPHAEFTLGMEVCAGAAVHAMGESKRRTTREVWGALIKYI